MVKKKNKLSNHVINLEAGLEMGVGTDTLHLLCTMRLHFEKADSSAFRHQTIILRNKFMSLCYNNFLLICVGHPPRLFYRCGTTPYF